MYKGRPIPPEEHDEERRRFLEDFAEKVEQKVQEQERGDADIAAQQEREE